MTIRISSERRRHPAQAAPAGGGAGLGSGHAEVVFLVAPSGRLLGDVGAIAARILAHEPRSAVAARVGDDFGEQKRRAGAAGQRAASLPLTLDSESFFLQRFAGSSATYSQSRLLFLAYHDVESSHCSGHVPQADGQASLALTLSESFFLHRLSGLSAT